jgi:hypothetical protein
MNKIHKIILIVLAIIFLLLISGYADAYYCHNWDDTQEPKLTLLCKINKYPSLIGGLVHVIITTSFFKRSYYNGY